MYNNLGNLVSRVLDAENHSFLSAVFQPLKPPLDSEWNLVQAINNDRIKTLLNSTIPSGFLQIGQSGTEVTTLPVGATSLWANTFKFISPVANVNGWLIHVGGGTNQFQTGTTENIWKILSSNQDEVVFIMGNPPSSGSRTDLIFLEVWEELITPSSQIYKYGFVQSGDTSFSNDLIDPNINQPTTLRTQVKYRIRLVEGVDFSSFREGVNHPSVFAQGATATPNSNYNFLKTPQGHYVAGNGNQQDSVNLGTVDGCVYALPLFAVNRKNSSAYSISNVNGAGAAIGGVSDRPDGAFNNQIAANDIEDLRHLIDLNDDLKTICEESLSNVIKGVPDRLESGTGAQSNSKVNMQIDGISSTARANISSVFNRRPNGFQRNFSDREITQRSIQYFSTGSVDGNNNFDLTPPVFYTVTDATNYNDFNPYIGSRTVPVIYDASSGLPIAGNTSVGLQGWSNLGDKLNKGVATFTPLNPNDITSSTGLIVEYDLVIPPGTGLSHLPDNIYGITDDVKNLPVAFTVDGAVKKTILSRTTNGYTDYATYRPVSNYINPTVLKENFRAGSFELTYYVAGNGTNSVTIPATINNIPVLSVLRVQDPITTFDIPLGIGLVPKVQNLAGGAGFQITFSTYNPNHLQTVAVTLVMAGTLVEFSTFNKGVNNFSTTNIYTIQSNGSSTSYSVVLSGQSGTGYAEYAYALTGLSELGFITNAYCYTATSLTATQNLTQISSVNFGSGRIVTINFTTPPPAGYIFLPMLVSFCPSATNQYTITYDTVPYNGFSLMLTPNESMEAEVVYLSDKALLTTGGTGGSVNLSPDDTVGAETRLPVNSLDSDCTFANDNLQLTRSFNAIGSLKYADYFYNQADNTNQLNVGDLLLITDFPTSTPQYMARGAALSSPPISYSVEDILTFIVEEDISTQVFTTDGVTYNSTFVLKNKIMSVLGTEAITLAFPTAGLATFNQGQNTVTGSGAFFTSQLKAGLFIRPLNGSWYQIKSITNDNSLILTEPFFESSIAGTAFEIFLPDLQVFIDGSRVPFGDIVFVDGNTSTFKLNPSASYLQFAGAHQTPKFSVRYRTATNVMGVIYGLAVGKGFVNAGSGTVSFSVGSLNVIGTGTNFPASVLPGYSIRLTGTTQWYEIAQVTSIQVVSIVVKADSSGSLQSTYFNLNTTTQLYSFWFNVSGVGGAQPSGTPGLPVQINITENGSATANATAIAAALSNYGFVVSQAANTLTVTSVVAGPVSPVATPGTSGFTVTPSTSSVIVLTEPYNGQGVVQAPPSELDADGDTDGPPVNPNAIVPGSYEILNPDLENELFLFTLTTTSNTDIIDTVNTNTFNLLKQGSANKLIFNNNLDTTLFQANRVLVAADLFYTKNRRLKVNQKV